jgi:hypothetical protein
MSNDIRPSDSEVQTLDQLLALAADATTPASAFYLDEASATKVSDLKNTLAEQTDAQGVRA